MDIEQTILSQLKSCKSMPFLFVGSGFSQRYIKTENWEGLLRLFASHAKPGNDFAYDAYMDSYRHSKDTPNIIMPKVATDIEKDFNQIWYSSAPEWQESRNRNGALAKKVSPFKIAIAEHLNAKKLDITSLSASYQAEISWLQQIGERSIAGAITTNYDSLLEVLFPKFKVFIGQEKLIFSSPQNISEIYKIHGCCSDPDSIIINSPDYTDFDKRNAYLAAKLLTMFVDHPIIFLGYSINDSDVEIILKSIIECLSQEKLSTLKDRLIFVEYKKDQDIPTMSVFEKSFEGGKVISMTKITTKEYSPILTAMLANKSKYPVHILRRLKEEIYQLVLTNDPHSKLYVKDFESIGDDDNIEIVAGIGVIMGLKGYEGVSAEDLYHDVVFDKGGLDKKLTVEKALPRVLRGNSYTVPIFKYISETDRSTLCSEIQRGLETKIISPTLENLKARKQYRSISEVLSNVPFPKCLDQIALLDKDEIEQDELEDYLKQLLTENPCILSPKANATIKTSVKRLIRILDWLKYCK